MEDVGSCDFVRTAYLQFLLAQLHFENQVWTFNAPDTTIEGYVKYFLGRLEFERWYGHLLCYAQSLL